MSSASSPNNYIILIVVFNLFIIIGILGNGMICFCMWKTKSLRTPVNNLILNMAIVGIMSSVTCLPLKVVIIAYEGLGHHFIRIEGIFIFFVVLHSLNLFFTSVQLLTLASISFERYQAIAKPFEKTKRSRRVRVTLLITWLIATGNWLCYVIIEIYAWNKTRNYLDLFIYDKWFFVVGFLPFTSLVICTIVVLYSQIVQLISLHIKKTEAIHLTNKVKPTPEPQLSTQSSVFLTNIRSLNDISTKESLKLTSLGQNERRSTSQTEQDERKHFSIANNLNIPDAHKSNQDTDNEKDVHKDVDSNVTDMEHLRSIEEVRVFNQISKSAAAHGTQLVVSTSSDRAVQHTENVPKTKVKDYTVAGPICVYNPKNREHGKRHLEAKTAKLAGIVIVIFLSLWMPYQIDIIHYVITHGLLQENFIHNRLLCNSELITQTLAIGAVVLSPIVFTFVNSDLRRETTKTAICILSKCT